MLSFFIDRWQYTIAEMPQFAGVKLPLISMHCFGPLEVNELGIDADNRPYELHEWMEDDLYEDENYCRNISVDELVAQIKDIRELLQKRDLSMQVHACERMISWLKDNYSERKT